MPSLTPTSSTALKAPRPPAAILVPRRPTSTSMAVCVLPRINGIFDDVKTANSLIGNYGPGQQGGYAAPQQGQSPAAYGAGPMGYSGPPSAGGYGRGQGPNNQQQQQQQQWNQQQPPAGPGQNFGGNNGYSGYQG